MSNVIHYIIFRFLKWYRHPFSFKEIYRHCSQHQCVSQHRSDISETYSVRSSSCNKYCIGRSVSIRRTLNVKRYHSVLLGYNVHIPTPFWVRFCNRITHASKRMNATFERSAAQLSVDPVRSQVNPSPSYWTLAKKELLTKGVPDPWGIVRVTRRHLKRCENKMANVDKSYQDDYNVFVSIKRQLEERLQMMPEVVQPTCCCGAKSKGSMSNAKGSCNTALKGSCYTIFSSTTCWGPPKEVLQNILQWKRQHHHNPLHNLRQCLLIARAPCEMKPSLCQLQRRVLSNPRLRRPSTLHRQKRSLHFSSSWRQSYPNLLLH